MSLPRSTLAILKAEVIAVVEAEVIAVIGAVVVRVFVWHALQKPRIELIVFVVTKKRLLEKGAGAGREASPQRRVNG